MTAQVKNQFHSDKRQKMSEQCEEKTAKIESLKKKMRLIKGKQRGSMKKTTAENVKTSTYDRLCLM